MKYVALLFSCTCFLNLYAQDYKLFPMWNHELSVEERVNDVINRLTLEEKVAQMLNAAPAIPRLGIPAYDWWNEVLHGVARTPFKTTVFPQAIGMAATWDTNSLALMAHYSALEGRAIYNKALASGRTNERYLGLTYWTPNINIFRDPRWGRGQETYGEDPFLTAMLGRAFVRGLQGEDPKYLKAAACAKHFAIHSGPEPTRHSDNFNPVIYDLWDTYLPAFKELIVHANVAGVMCAYNAVNGQPCCANDVLMNNILRNQWKFSGYVTSDCWAIDDFFKYHKTHPDAVSAATDAVLHGTDIECGQTVYKSLVDAVHKGLLKAEQLNVSLKRLFTIRFRLGMFDPVEIVKYAQTPASILEAPNHQQHALQMARQSIVLLRNENNTLPLSKKIRKIAVLGPNADNSISVLGNYNGIPSRIVTILQGIKDKLSQNTEVLYEKGVNFTNDTMMVYENISHLYSFNNAPGIQAEYFNNKNLEGTAAAVNTINDIDFYFTEGQSPVTGINSTQYSVRFTTYLHAPKTEIRNFESEGDDGYRIYINDSLIVNAWQRNRWGAKQFQYKFEEGKQYKVVVEYFQSEGNASIKFKTGRNIKTDYNAFLSKIMDADVIVFVGGISPQLEGEEMPVNAPGFNGGDRTTIVLPEVQTGLMKVLKKTGKPVVFIMMTGSAIATPWESENIPAVVNAWYGGQSAGTAVADVLFGDYNPAGRLPIIFYSSDADLPAFSDYSMSNRTYRYFKGKALYPFGFGLSYTNFTYSNMNLPKTIPLNSPVKIKVQVQNTGSIFGEEVVQLYVSHQNKNKAPLRALKGFKRIALKAGETIIVEFTLTPENLSLADENTGQLFQPAGKVLVSVGGNQPGIQIKTTSNSISKLMQIK